MADGTVVSKAESTLLEIVMPKKGTEDHLLARADYFKGLVMKTTDPVHWEKHDLLAAEEALNAVKDSRHERKYEHARAMIESAKHKASHDASY